MHSLSIPRHPFGPASEGYDDVLDHLVDSWQLAEQAYRDKKAFPKDFDWEGLWDTLWDCTLAVENSGYDMASEVVSALESCLTAVDEVLNCYLATVREADALVAKQTKELALDDTLQGLYSREAALRM